MAGQVPYSPFRFRLAAIELSRAVYENNAILWLRWQMPLFNPINV
jgi:hypothetical protein